MLTVRALGWGLGLATGKQRAASPLEAFFAVADAAVMCVDLVDGTLGYTLVMPNSSG